MRDINIGPAPMSLCCFIEQNRLILLSDGWAIEDVPCARLAEWTIYDGPRPDDYTEACTEHVGYLLSDADELRVYPLRGNRRVTT